MKFLVKGRDAISGAAIQTTIEASDQQTLLEAIGRKRIVDACYDLSTPLASLVVERMASKAASGSRRVGWEWAGLIGLLATFCWSYAMWGPGGAPTPSAFVVAVASTKPSTKAPTITVPIPPSPTTPSIAVTIVAAPQTQRVNADPPSPTLPTSLTALRLRQRPTQYVSGRDEKTDENKTDITWAPPDGPTIGYTFYGDDSRPRSVRMVCVTDTGTETSQCMDLIGNFFSDASGEQMVGGWRFWITNGYRANPGNHKRFEATQNGKRFIFEITGGPMTSMSGTVTSIR